MSAALDARLRAVYGVELATSAWIPKGDAEPDELLRAAESIGAAIGDRTAAAPVAEPAWVALPRRPELPPLDRRAAIEGVLAWARDRGARWDGIEVQVAADASASMRASRSLASGETILTLPRKLMVIDNQLGLPSLPPRDALAAWLGIEANDPASRWRAFLDVQPVRLELPMFVEDLGALAGTAAHAIAAEENRDAVSAYGQLPAALRARVSLADFAWGCAIVKSRGFHAPGAVEHRLALLPVVDLFDHRLGDTTWSYSPLDETFVISTERAFAAGEPVHFPYGDRSNTRLLVHFGFVDPANPTREAALLFDRAPDPTNAIAAHLLWMRPLDGPTRMRIAAVFDDRFLRALSVARLIVASPAGRARALEEGLAPYGYVPWLGVDQEAAALAVMREAAERALAANAAHARPAADAWSRSCATVRADERAVLSTVHAFAVAAAHGTASDDPVVDQLVRDYRAGLGRDLDPPTSPGRHRQL